MIIVWSDALLRYPEFAKLPDTSSPSQVRMIQLAEGYISSRLSSKFTVPFESNNLTAQDLIIDCIYVQQNFMRHHEKTEILKDYLEERIKALLEGGSMVTTSGTVSGEVNAAAWSSTQNYHPTFGMSAPEMWAVNSDMLIAENTARGSTIDEAV